MAEHMLTPTEQSKGARAPQWVRRKLTFDQRGTLLRTVARADTRSPTAGDAIGPMRWSGICGVRTGERALKLWGAAVAGWFGRMGA